ncbi:hypothetical protein [Phenylobacterium sp.]|uniref:hypothetical protein n=1 Tax=Phenylobacterium sp. TaxID=1871053 RepID=UPI0025D4F843|nr:hypothetical protein [Phenylobacterium sp.]MCA6309210.1 serine/threonine protein kinase [Phenylobacterium sp.]MCA6322864.1 serine/threonine protein kinase [Phenylobacterium sp.]MCA6336771.1 serine/threonine protein kinase [Phenylobacterium sp.]MCA6339260.1 serine/threonine protein kinase [Phenylobacterium sp.]MCA6342425.1 serine/threonine protein kinase [Phenylobacterium sp.]
MHEIPPLLPFDSIPGDIRDRLTAEGEVFVDLGDGEFGCRGAGFEYGGSRYFVKFAVSGLGMASQSRAIAVHSRVQHPTLVPLIQIMSGDQGPILVFPWVDAAPLRQSQRMRRVPLSDVLRAICDVIDVHAAIEAAGFVSIDLYDGNLLYNDRVHLIDVDEYQPVPFRLDAPRTLGSTRFMAPEEYHQGAWLDSRTMVFQLGRAMAVLLDPPSGDNLDRCPALGPVIGQATASDPEARYPTVVELAAGLGDALAQASLSPGCS